MRSLQEIGESLYQRGIFTGGPIEYFERMGRMQFSLMVREGIYPWSKVLDIGCGCLRGGYWMAHFLNPDCYCGIEPNVSMVNAGLSEIIEPEMLIAKRPRIDHNAVFDSSVFGVTFDAFLARSIWTHASKAMIATMLDNFVRDSSSRAFFLASYLPARWPWEDYKGTVHVGKSHVSKIPGLVKHSRRWIKSECQARGLSVRELSDGILMDQKWLKICRLPSESPVYPYRNGRRVED